VRNSVDGYDQVWRAVLDRFFARFSGPGAGGDQRLWGPRRDGDAALEQRAEEVRLMPRGRHGEPKNHMRPAIASWACQSVIEMRARDRAGRTGRSRTVRENCSARSTAGISMDSIEHIVPESDDGVIGARGLLAGACGGDLAIGGSLSKRR